MVLGQIHALDIFLRLGCHNIKCSHPVESCRKIVKWANLLFWWRFTCGEDCLVVWSTRLLDSFTFIGIDWFLDRFTDCNSRIAIRLVFSKSSWDHVSADLFFDLSRLLDFVTFCSPPTVCMLRTLCWGWRPSKCGSLNNSQYVIWNKYLAYILVGFRITALFGGGGFWYGELNWRLKKTAIENKL